jgi:chaperone modulatory protein CbpM
MMLTVDALFVEIRGLRRPDLERWISNAWVRPDGDPEHYLFREIDVARIRLIMELRENLDSPRSSRCSTSSTTCAAACAA